MPRGQQYATNMAQLMIASGNVQAEAARRKGELWGSTMASLGQIPQQVQQIRQQRDDRALQADAYGRQREMEQLTLEDKRAAADKRRRMQEVLSSAEDLPSALTALERIDPQAALELQNDLVTNGMKRIEAIARIAPTVKDQQSHMAARQELSALGIPVPLTYTPEWWDERMMAAMTGKEQIDLLRQQRQDRQAENQQGVRRMLGEAVVQRGGQPLDPGTQQTMEGMALQEGVTLPASMTRQAPLPPNPTEASLAAAAARGDPDAVAALRILKQQNATAADVTALSAEGLDMAALNYKRTGLMPALGMGDRSTRQNIINRAAQLTTADEERISAGIGDIAGNRANYRADSGSLAALQKQRDAITSFEQTASKNIDIFLETAGKIVDTGSPFANSVARAVSGQALGSPDVAAYNAARQVAINEVAKITSNPNMSGVLSDTARKEVEAFNPANATLKQTVAVMRILKRDMANRTLALDETLRAIRARMGGQQRNQSSSPQAPAGWKYVPKPGGGWTAVEAP